MQSEGGERELREDRELRSKLAKEVWLGAVPPERKALCNT